MDFALPEELQLLQDTVRKFVDQELIPVEMECRDGVTLKPEYRERFEAKTREMGLWMLDVPEEFGGAGHHLGGDEADVDDGVGAEFFRVGGHSADAFVAGFHQHFGVFLNLAAHDGAKAGEEVFADVFGANGVAANEAEIFGDSVAFESVGVDD